MNWSPRWTPLPRSLLLGLLITGFATLAVLPLSRSVGAGGIVRQPDLVSRPTNGRQISVGQTQSQAKAKVFPNIDIRVNAPAEVVRMIGIAIPATLSIQTARVQVRDKDSEPRVQRILRLRLTAMHLSEQFCLTRR